MHSGHRLVPQGQIAYGISYGLPTGLPLSVPSLMSLGHSKQRAAHSYWTCGQVLARREHQKHNSVTWTTLAAQIMLHNLTGRFASYSAIARSARLRYSDGDVFGGVADTKTPYTNIVDG